MIDLFGEEREPPVPEKGARKRKTMQETYRTLDGFTCGQCKHCICNHWNGKNYYKCELWHISYCSATDIRLKDTACRKFEVTKNNKDIEGMQ